MIGTALAPTARGKYTWTTDPTNGGVSDVGSYVPAIGPIALLADRLVTRLPSRGLIARQTSTAAIITALFGLGVSAFYDMYLAIDVPLHR